MRAFVDVRARGHGALRAALPATHPGLRAVARVLRRSPKRCSRARSDVLHAAGLEATGRRRLLRRHGRRPHRRADQQRPRWRPLDSPPRPARRHVPRRAPRTRRTADDAEPDRTTRGPSARRGGVRALRRRSTAALTPDEWALPDRLHRVGRPQGRAARARLRRRAGVVPAVRAPAPAGRAAQQGDRLAPLGRRDERAADPRALAPLQRRARRAARDRRAEGGEGPVAHAAARCATCRSRSGRRSAGRR